MKCQKCGYSLPEDSEFCQYCGTRLEHQFVPEVSTKTVNSQTNVNSPTDAVIVEHFPKLVPEVAPVASVAVPIERLEPAVETKVPPSMPASKNAEEFVRNEKHTFCKKCGSAIDPITKKCGGCGKQYFRVKKAVPIFLSVLLVASLFLNVIQYLQGKEQYLHGNEAIEKIEYFDKLCEELSTGKIGFASGNFYASESVIVVDKEETNRKFLLTASWEEGRTVSVNYSGNSARVDFDLNAWANSTKMTIKPQEEGVTAVTFSNDGDSRTFKVLIIVTD